MFVADSLLSAFGRVLVLCPIALRPIQSIGSLFGSLVIHGTISTQYVPQSVQVPMCVSSEMHIDFIQVIAAWHNKVLVLSLALRMVLLS